ncbi:hypothetical protein, partial [Herbaspirillum frisingense]|uniref:hypothetical protein n=1 Tax=Herbaspirillum frisingense TaxID=92645 RepID=UPI0039AF57B2
LWRVIWGWGGGEPGWSVVLTSYASALAQIRECRPASGHVPRLTGQVMYPPGIKPVTGKNDLQDFFL